MTRQPVLVVILVAGLAMLLGGCGGQEDKGSSHSGLTQAQRDSVLAKSILPGAAAVGRALEVADSATARAKRIDDATP